MDNAQCYQTLREIRWPDSVKCPHCKSKHIARRGFDDTERSRQRYQCKKCKRRFDDVTGTIFSGHHQPVKIWIIVLYFMGLNISNSQIAYELDLNVSDVQKMTETLREGIDQKKTCNT